MGTRNSTMQGRWRWALVAGFIGLVLDGPVAWAVVTDIYPRLDCVDRLERQDQEPRFVAQFGYTNLNATPQFVEMGDLNKFLEPPAFRNQPETFLPGTHFNGFSTPFDPQVGLRWSLLNNVAIATAAMVDKMPCDLETQLRAAEEQLRQLRPAEHPSR